MRQRLRISLMALVVLAVLGTTFWVVLPPKEPVYQGKPLSYWLGGYVRLNIRGVHELPPSKDQADEAVRAIGTNAIPTLLRMLQAHDSALEKPFYLLAKRQHFVNLNWRYPRAFIKMNEAMMAFQAMGPQSVNLLPELTRIYDANPSPISRQAVVAIVRYVAPQNEQALPLLQRALTDTNDFILRHNAASTLGDMGLRADQVMPALIQALNDPEPEVRAMAAKSLGNFGLQARSAKPALQKLLEAEEAKRGGRPPSPSSGTSDYYFADVSLSKQFRAGPFFLPVDVSVEVRKALKRIEPEDGSKELLGPDSN